MKLIHFELEVDVDSYYEAVKIANVLQEYDRLCSFVRVPDKLLCRNANGEYVTWHHPLTGETIDRYRERYNLVNKGETEIEKEILDYWFDGKISEMYESVSYMHNCSHEYISKVVDKLKSRGIIK